MLQVQLLPIELLKPNSRNVRTHSRKQISQIARSIRDFGFNNPILIDRENLVIGGHGRLLASKELGLKEVPTIRLEHLDGASLRAYILADNKLAEKAGWDKDILKIELQSLIALDIDIDLTCTGFETPEIDIILHTASEKPEADPLDYVPVDVPKRVNRGDLWRVGSHFVFCGDALKPESFDALLQGRTADTVVTDPPYNVAVDGHVCGTGKVKHSEFAFASGEMSETEFKAFLKTAFKNLSAYSIDGSLHFIFMDWRHISEIMAAGREVYTDLKNVCVWNKILGGLGSLYRSQHEFVFVFKNGTAPHVNNIELGRHGRNRTNVWDYAGVNSASHRRDELKLHPTIKPVRMLSDAIIDCSKQGAIVLDCFAGSGSTLLAAEHVKRKAYVMEFEPKYCDVILYRYEQAFGDDIELVKNLSIKDHTPSTNGE